MNDTALQEIKRLQQELQEAKDFQVRLQALDELLPTLSGVLDIRDVFELVAGIARRVIPHDSLSLPLVTDDKQNLVVYAVSGFSSRIPATIPLRDHHRPLLTDPWDHIISVKRRCWD